MLEEKKPKLGSVREDGQPVIGMKFEDSRKKLLKYESSRANPNLKESLIGQVEKHEGPDAAEDLRTEINYKYNVEGNRGAARVDFIHNPNGKLTSPGWDSGRGKIYTWCDSCGERCYIYTVIKGSDGKLSISRCNKCGTDCMELNEIDYELKEEESNARKNN